MHVLPNIREEHPSEGLCTLCNIGSCEDEIHFISLSFVKRFKIYVNLILLNNQDFCNK